MRNTEFKYFKYIDYRRIYKELEVFCIKETDPLLIGEFGDSSFPSISDLDVFICLKDHEFAKQKERIVTFIDSSLDRQYIFFHDPLILPESLMPYFRGFHTAYNLNLTYQNGDNLISEINVEQLEILNTIWTTFLMSTGPEILVSAESTSRTKLLVLKNICQSISNIDHTDEALLFSDELRKRYFENKLNDEDIHVSFQEKLNELYFKSNELKIFKDYIPIKKSKYRVARNRTVMLSNINSFIIKDDKIQMRLNPQFFNFFSQFYYRKSYNNLVQEYIDNSAKVWKICKSIDLKYPFIIPFGLQFYRTDLKYNIKKRIFSIIG